MTTRWAPLSLEELWVGDVAGIRITTSRAAHLTLRYTYKEPVKTLHPKQKRGAFWYYDNKLCFVEWAECEQDEPGDTFIHTFSCPIFPFCVKVWYIFVGTIGGAPSPSNTAIFEAHMTWPPPPPVEAHIYASPTIGLALCVNARWPWGIFGEILPYAEAPVSSLREGSSFGPAPDAPAVNVSVS